MTSNATATATALSDKEHSLYERIMKDVDPHDPHKIIIDISYIYNPVEKEKIKRQIGGLAKDYGRDWKSEVKSSTLFNWEYILVGLSPVYKHSMSLKLLGRL